MEYDKEYPYTCSICNKEQMDYLPIYPDMICPDCEDKAVDENGDTPWNDSWKDDGSNPVFIEGIKCWRRYKFGGWKTMTYDGWKEYRKRFTTIEWAD